MYDNLNLASNKSFMKQLNNETIYFSGNIQKINRSNKTQDRYILITNKNYY